MTNTTPNQHEWDTPHEFEGVQLSEWPKDAFPDHAQRYIEELSRSTETPIELASLVKISQNQPFGDFQNQPPHRDHLESATWRFHLLRMCHNH